MSADNGIYILQTKDGFRVTHAQAIENLNWWKKEEGQFEERMELNPKVVYDYFSSSIVVSTREEALKIADEMYQRIMDGDFPILEYGISFITGMEDQEFPTEGSEREEEEIA